MLRLWSNVKSLEQNQDDDPELKSDENVRESAEERGIDRVN
jgi:hypothetical protein